MRARLKSGSFHVRFPDARMYNKGDVIDDIEKVPVVFRDRWEELPSPKRRDIPAPVVKEEPAAKEDLSKKKTTPKPSPVTKKTTTRKPRTTTKKTGSKRVIPKKS